MHIDHVLAISTVNKRVLIQTELFKNFNSITDLMYSSPNNIKHSIKYISKCTPKKLQCACHPIMPSSLVYSKSACFNQLSIEVLKPPCIGSEKSKKGDTLTIHHTKTLIDGTVVYSSYELGRVLDLKIGKGNEIKGMEQGLLGYEICLYRRMGVGEIRKLEIPSALGNLLPI
ncbi:hypothetical protein HZS_1834 [Henneguya salminicola]|nr:hypothetical protein HZS_1834 [Henneguya salminicola]